MAKRQQRDPKREAFWRGVLTRFGKSGKSVRGFCADEQLSEASFYFWRRAIRERDGEPARLPTAFVPLVVNHDPPADSDEALVIEVRGSRGTCILHLSSALPVRQVAALVHAITAAPESVRPDAALGARR